MDWGIFFTAIGLMLVIEGILPFICPDCWRKVMLQAAGQPDHLLRMLGLASMLFGLLFVIFS